MGMPPMPPAGDPPSMPPAQGAGGGGSMPDLQTLWAALPPEFQSKLDPNNAITKLHYNRLRNLSPEDGDNLLELMGKATPPELRAFKAAFPELDLLLDLFDDGELNNSVGAEGGGGMDPAMSAGPGAPARPAPMGEEPYEEEEEEYAPRGGRLNAIMA